MMAYLQSAVIGVCLAGALLLWEARPVAPPPAPPAAVAVVTSDAYAYIGPPTISRAVYASVFCAQNGADSAICQQAPAMYDAVVAAGADPALELAHAGNESSFGTGGVGMAPWHNLHGIHGHAGGLGTPFVNSAPGDEDMQQYASYADAVADWVWLIRDGGLYYPERNDPESVLAIYCECGGASGKAAYVARMQAQIDGWRAQSSPPAAQSAPVGHKANVTPTMEAGARFDTADCSVWGFQAGCQHWGTDLLGPEGTPVHAPFDLTIIALGEYGPGPTWGQYVQGTFADGYVFYAGHLEARQEMQVGQTLPAGTLLGFTNSYAHTHIQLGPPGNAGACAQDGSCLDFERYFEEH